MWAHSRPSDIPSSLSLAACVWVVVVVMGSVSTDVGPIRPNGKPT